MKFFVILVNLFVLLSPVISTLQFRPFDGFTDQDRHDFLLYKLMNQGEMDFAPHFYTVKEATDLMKRLPRSLSHKYDMANAGHLSVNGNGEIPKLRDHILLGMSVNCGEISKPHSCFEFILPRRGINYSPSRAMFKMTIDPQYETYMFRAYLMKTSGGNILQEEAISGPTKAHGTYEYEVFIDLTSFLRETLTALPNKNRFTILVLCENCSSSSSMSSSLTPDPIAVLEIDRHVLRVTHPDRRRKRAVVGNNVNFIRSRDCDGLPGTMDRCCRIKDEIELNSGTLRNLSIVLPTRLPLHLCGGSCDLHNIPVRHQNVEYTNNLMGFLSEERRQLFEKHLPCCSANRTTTLNILTTEGGNRFLMHSLPLTVVEECACA